MITTKNPLKIQSFCLLFATFLFLAKWTVGQTKTSNTAKKVKITGKITNPSSFKHAGQFHNEPIHFYIDNWLFDQEFVEIPNDDGEFRFAVNLSQSTPAYFTYGDYIGKMFWTPGDELHITFDYNVFRATLMFSGKGSVQNSFFADFERKFDTQGTQGEIESNLHYTHNRFSAYINVMKQNELAFLRQYIAQKSTSSAFQGWAKAEIQYRAANHIHKHYFQEAPSPTDGYQSFATQYILNNETALVSNEYLKFLDNHLRQLCVRDPKEVRQARRERKELWPVRAYELSKTVYRGAVKEHAQAKLIMSMIDAEEANAQQLNTDFQRTATDTGLKRLVSKRYEKLAKFLAAPLPNGAKLHTISDSNPATFKQVLAEHKGKVLYIDFWASWCKPCIAEMRFSKDLHQNYQGKNVAFLYFSSDETEGSWKANIARYHLNGSHYLMGNNFKNKAYEALQVYGLPRYVLIDQTGKVVLSSAPPPSSPDAKKEIDKLLR